MTRLGDARWQDAPGRDENTSGLRGHQGDPQWAEDGPEEAPVRAVGPTIHGVECYEAWRASSSCPHEVKGYADDEATF